MNIDFADDQNITSVIGHNLFMLYENIYNITPSVSLIKADGLTSININNSVWPRYIYNIDFRSASLNERLEKIVHNIKKRKVPPFLLVGPDFISEHNHNIIEDNGFIKIAEWQGMAMDMKSFTINNYKPVIEIVTVGNQNQLNDWYHIVREELYSNKKLEKEIFYRFHEENNTKLFIGYAENKPVTTSMSFVVNNVAGLYMIATKREYRKLGFGKAITHHAMKDSKQSGANICILQSTIDGYPIYKKIGFKEYCEFSIYWLAGKEYKF